MVEATEKLLSISRELPKTDIFDCLERSKSVLQSENEEDVASGLNWLIANYERLLERQPVTTVPESLSYANSLLQEERANG